MKSNSTEFSGWVRSHCPKVLEVIHASSYGNLVFNEKIIDSIRRLEFKIHTNILIEHLQSLKVILSNAQAEKFEEIFESHLKKELTNNLYSEFNLSKEFTLILDHLNEGEISDEEVSLLQKRFEYYEQFVKTTSVVIEV